MGWIHSFNRVNKMYISFVNDLLKNVPSESLSLNVEGFLKSLNNINGKIE